MNKAASPDAQSLFRFATKATTLEQLEARISRARVCDQITVAVERWRDERETVLTEIIERFGPRPLAVRSSAACEDGRDNSFAGVNLSRTDVEPTPEAVAIAIDEVISSYQNPSAGDQVLVQPMVGDVAISGVVLTRDLDTGSPYYVINYDDFSGRTDTVTGGAESKSILVHRSRPDALHSQRFRKVVDSVIELEQITGSQELDIEFCVTRQEHVYILQVRPLAARQYWNAPEDNVIDRALDGIRGAIAERMSPRPGLAGRTTIFSEMTDWNPAEMIGNSPRPLALSLYKRLITDSTWAKARASMGYRRIDRPLLIDFFGRPYIDVRLSFNSFLPADIDDDFAHRLVNYQLDRLADCPELDDKVEFDIAITCRDLNFAHERDKLSKAGFQSEELNAYEDALAGVTRSALGSWKKEIDRLVGLSCQLLRDRPELESLMPLERARRLFDDCTEQGILPFSVLARHGFIGMLFLRSLVVREVFTPEDYDRFMLGIHTVATDLVRDMHALAAGTLDKGDFMARYGHLRPGTYDILSWRYDERPDLYLGLTGRELPVSHQAFEPSAHQQYAIEGLLRESGYDLSPQELLAYIRTAVKAREQAKFAFTRSISDALSALATWGEAVGLSREQLSFLPIEEFADNADAKLLKERVERQQEAYRLTRALRMPQLISEPSDIDVVRLPLGKPTFITGKVVTAKARRLTYDNTADLDGHIVLIESADPGFDWIFSHAIAGLITKYGGTNSHMSIRCAEFGLPAAIGCGERLFESLAKTLVIELNCTARKVSGH